MKRLVTVMAISLMLAGCAGEQKDIGATPSATPAIVSTPSAQATTEIGCVKLVTVIKVDSPTSRQKELASAGFELSTQVDGFDIWRNKNAGDKVKECGVMLRMKGDDVMGITSSKLDRWCAVAEPSVRIRDIVNAFVYMPRLFPLPVGETKPPANATYQC